MAAIAWARSLDVPALGRHLRGDLDCVVMKALEKHRARRYATVSGLMGDLENYLQHRPVAARAPGKWHRFQKFVRRNRTAFAAASAVTIALILGATVSLYQAVRASRAEKAAKAEAAKSAQEAHFMADIFKACGPAVAMGRDTTLVREILDQAVARIDRELAGQKAVQADLRITLAETYHQLGLYPQMEGVARKAFSDSKSSGDRAVMARELDQLADALAHQNELVEAEMTSREALVLRRKLFGDQAADVGVSLNNLGLIVRQRGRMKEAEQLFRAAIFVDHNLNGRPGAKNSSATANLGAVLWSEGRLPEAETAYREALAGLRAHFREDHPELATTLNNLATVLLDENKLAEAENLCREAVALDRKYLDGGHPDLAIALGNLGNILAAQKHFEEAEKADRESLAITRKISGVRPDEVMLRLRTLGQDLASQGKVKKAELMFGEAGAQGR